MQTLLHGGTVLTMEHEDARAQSVLLRDGRIVAVGTDADVRADIDPQQPCEQIDLAGACLMPSFIDPHGHLMLYGVFTTLVDLADCSDISDMIEALSREARSRPAGDDTPVVGVRYDHNRLAEQRHPRREELDQVPTDAPVFVLHRSVHLGAANSAALAAAGIDATTTDPSGGRFGRATNGDPDGYVEEMPAIALIAQALAVPGQGPGLVPGARVDADQAVLAAQAAYLARGITTAQEGAATPDDVAAYARLAAQGDLDLDIVVYPLAPLEGLDQFAAHPQLVGLDPTRRVRLGGCKLILDGAPQGRSAWMSTPYEPIPGEQTCACGYPAMPSEDVLEHVRAVAASGHQLLVHCNGDAAADQYLDAYDQVLTEDPGAGRCRPVMIHAQTVREDQLQRMARLGMTASFFPGHVEEWGDVHRVNLGDERAARISPARSALDLGVPVTLHQDAPVTEPDMLRTVRTAVLRRTRSGYELGPEQRISVFEALCAVTRDAAVQYGEQETLGCIAPGMRADLVILDQCPLDVQPEELADIAVLRTIKDGRTVYRADVPTPTSAPMGAASPTTGDKP